MSPTGRGRCGATEVRGRGARPTLDALESMAGGREDLDQALVIRLARAALFGVTATA